MATLSQYTLYLCLVGMGGSALWKEIAGPYDVALKHVTNCDRRGSVSFFELMKVRKLNRTHFVCNGLLTIAVDLDDDAKLRGVAAIKGTNGRYNNVIDVELKACDFILKFGKNIVESLIENCDSTYVCPMKRNTCELKNWTISHDFIDIPALPYGEYRLDLSLLEVLQDNKKQLISCVRFYGTITPKNLNKLKKA
ncbi:uncharacterized protein LOC120351143 [Nilaparvata lugens]|uniref:uncharacterized protein LOC120351143 n=1 Tax=Nilaparvata lugens TaxID=108931 RepID=UPI00193E598E|nr:uncharacterized protein LOC120351143 [Nilaparvata lugens]